MSRPAAHKALSCPLWTTQILILRAVGVIHTQTEHSPCPMCGGRTEENILMLFVCSKFDGWCFLPSKKADLGIFKAKFQNPFFWVKWARSPVIDAQLPGWVPCLALEARLLGDGFSLMSLKFMVLRERDDRSLFIKTLISFKISNLSYLVREKDDDKQMSEQIEILDTRVGA